ncbi:MAG: helix-turn-helix transcriptional regulator [Clostridia bacterium]|nr:helix-turn-helix transcriptional regulator [Clostridia bacterium]
MKIIFYRHNKSQAPKKIEPEKINFSELTILFDGKMKYSVDGKIYPLKKNDVIFLPEGSFRKRIANEMANYVSFNIIDDKPRDFFVLHNGLTNAVKYIIAACDEVYDHALEHTDERLSLLFSCLLLQLEKQQQNSLVHPLVGKIKEYVKENIDKKITLSDVGKHTFFSPGHCDRVFKKETKQSIIDYAIDSKIIEAKYILLTENVSLRAIADKLGFDDYNYFARLFKKRIGMTPTQYKNKVKNSPSLL